MYPIITCRDHVSYKSNGSKNPINNITLYYNDTEFYNIFYEDRQFVRVCIVRLHVYTVIELSI